MWALHRLHAEVHPPVRDPGPTAASDDAAKNTPFAGVDLARFPALGCPNFYCIQRHQATGGWGG